MRGSLLLIIALAGCAPEATCRLGPWGLQVFFAVSNPLQVALRGPGYFVLEGDEARPRLYTRDGDFHLDAAQGVVHRSGRALLGGASLAAISPLQLAAEQTVSARPTRVDVVLHTGPGTVSGVVDLSDGRSLTLSFVRLSSSSWALTLRASDDAGTSVAEELMVIRAADDQVIQTRLHNWNGNAFALTEVLVSRIEEDGQNALDVTVVTGAPVLVGTPAATQWIVAHFDDSASLQRLDDGMLAESLWSGPPRLSHPDEADLARYTLEASLPEGCAD